MTKHHKRWSALGALIFMVGASIGAFCLVQLSSVTSAGAAATAPTPKILFVRNSQLWWMNPDGTGQAALTSTSTNVGPGTLTAADSPGICTASGVTHVVFAGTVAGNKDIYSALLTTPSGLAGFQRLTTASTDDDQPELSADCSKVVWQSKQDGNAEIYIMAANGTGQTRLTNDPATDENPAFSPDGTKVVWDNNHNSQQTQVQVWTMNASNGSGATELTSTNNGAAYPHYSPDGSKIVFQGVSLFDVFVMDANGTNSMDLTASATGASSEPNWSPDGSQITFAESSGAPSFGDIYTMNANGSNQIDQSQSASADDSVPAWGNVVADSPPPTTTTSSSTTSSSTSSTSSSTTSSTVIIDTTTTSSTVPPTTSTTMPTTTTTQKPTTTTSSSTSTTVKPTTTTTVAPTTSTTAKPVVPQEPPLQVAPTVTAGSATAQPGQSVGLSGAGFDSNRSLDISFHSNVESLGSVTTDGNGKFTTTVVIPADATGGLHQIVVSESGSNSAAVPITVIPLATNALPRTGSPSWLIPLGLIGCLLMAVGGILRFATAQERQWTD